MPTARQAVRLLNCDPGSVVGLAVDLGGCMLRSDGSVSASQALCCLGAVVHDLRDQSVQSARAFSPESVTALMTAVRTSAKTPP
jgi:hypothetical protein